MNDKITTSNYDLMTIEKLYRTTNNVLSVTKGNLKNKSRKRHLVNARIMFARLARSQMSLTVQKIAELINKDHSTISYYGKLHNSLMVTDKEYKRMYIILYTTFTSRTYEVSESLSMHDRLATACATIEALEKENRHLRKTLSSIRRIIEN